MVGKLQYVPSPARAFMPVAIPKVLTLSLHSSVIPVHEQESPPTLSFRAPACVIPNGCEESYKSDTLLLSPSLNTTAFVHSLPLHSFISRFVEVCLRKGRNRVYGYLKIIVINEKFHIVRIYPLLSISVSVSF
jgi:hypothetical protein